MTRTIGSIDRIIRLVLGLGLVGVGVFAETWWGLIGLVPLLTGLLNWCPLYSLFGLSTFRSARSRAGT